MHLHRLRSCLRVSGAPQNGAVTCMVPRHTTAFGYAIIIEVKPHALGPVALSRTTICCGLLWHPSA